jgi:hypothetical protein
MNYPDVLVSGHFLRSQGHLNHSAIFNSMSQSSEMTIEVVRTVGVGAELAPVLTGVSQQIRNFVSAIQQSFLDARRKVTAACLPLQFPDVFM